MPVSSIFNIFATAPASNLPVRSYSGFYYNYPVPIPLPSFSIILHIPLPIPKVRPLWNISLLISPLFHPENAAAKHWYHIWYFMFPANVLYPIIRDWPETVIYPCDPPGESSDRISVSPEIYRIQDHISIGFRMKEIQKLPRISCRISRQTHRSPKCHHCKMTGILWAGTSHTPVFFLLYKRYSAGHLLF